MAVTLVMAVARMAMRLALRIVTTLLVRLDGGGWRGRKEKYFACLVDMLAW